MSKGTTTQTIEALVLPVLKELGLELVDIEYKREGKNWVLRIYIDKEGGITVNDCSQVSHQVGDLIDVDDLISNAYSLEVSSPGLDRPLKKSQDFLKFKSRRIRLTTFAPLGNRRNFKGVILDFRDDTLFLQAEDDAFEIQFNNIAKAKVVLESVK